MNKILKIVLITVILLVLPFVFGILKLNLNPRVEYKTEEAKIPSTYYCYNDKILDLNEYEREIKALKKNADTLIELLEPKQKSCIEDCVYENISTVDNDELSVTCGVKCGLESGTFEIASNVGKRKVEYQTALDKYCK